ncbi:MAG TPA: ATP-binding protein [Planctomycetota bacterium]|nr:ATP-binding protein [Planctomycetota bacterium]
MSVASLSETKERLLRYLERERLAERRAHRELRAKPLAERVECGEAITGLSLVSQGGGEILLSAPENAARFREGDTLWLGDGRDVERGLAVRLVRADAAARTVLVERDGRDEGGPVPSPLELVLDRRALDLGERFATAIEEVFADPAHPIVRCLAGEAGADDDPERLRKLTRAGRERGLDEWQAEAFARALAHPRIHLVQGPPGTGKTRLIAEILEACLAAGERVAVAAYTHRAVDQVLLRAAERCGRKRVAKLHGARGDAGELAAAGVLRISSAERHAASREAIVVGLTTHAACRLGGRVRFDRVVFDEAGQIPMPHGIAAMRLASRWTFVGDPAQLPPVVAGEHEEDDDLSIFEHLARRYPSTLLRSTYRMNGGVCDLPSRHFYAGKLQPSADAARRRLTLRDGGRFRDVLDPERPSVFVEVDHRGAAMRSRREAAIVAELLLELLAHHGLPAEEVAAVAPFRAQVAAIRQEIERRAAARGLVLARSPLVETIERIQGREHEVVAISLAASDPDWLASQSEFYFLPNRWNVALTRARTKRILVASPLAFETRARSLEDVPALALFARLRSETPKIDGASVEREIAATEKAREGAFVR